MKRKFVPAITSFAHWMKGPSYVAAYQALEAEFSLATATIKAQDDANGSEERVCLSISDLMP
jgi:hypothetical protein